MSSLSKCENDLQIGRSTDLLCFIRHWHYGELAVARINDATHAVVLTGVDEENETYTYYDPVLGTDDNVIDWEGIRDPLIITYIITN